MMTGGVGLRDMSTGPIAGVENFTIAIIIGIAMRIGTTRIITSIRIGTIKVPDFIPIEEEVGGD
jgi:hypothetical protein